MKRLLPFLLLLTTPATAQVVQPQYVRPSKGASLKVFSQPIYNGTTTVIPSDSMVFDWTAFAGVTVTMERSAPDDTKTNCGDFLTTRVYGGSTANAVIPQVINTPAAEYSTNQNFATWYVPVTAPFIKLSFYVFLVPGLTDSCTAPVTVKITPIPFDYGMGATVTAAYSRVDATITQTSSLVRFVDASGAKGYRHLRLQNLGTTPLICGIGGSVQGISLAAGSATDDGKGGVVELESYSGLLQCKCGGASPCTGRLGTATW